MPKSTYVLRFLVVAIVSGAGCEDADTEACTKGVYTGHVTIADKSDPAHFEGYTRVTGNLTISCPNCTAIDELSCLASVGGDLAISGNSALQTLDLGNLIFVGGSYYLFQNPVLAGFDTSRLRAVGSWLTVRQNAVLPDLVVDDLVVIGGDVTVEQNADIETLALGTVGQIPGSLAVADNATLKFLEAPELVAIDADLSLAGNPALADLTGLGNLVSVGGAIDVSHNGALPFCEVCTLLGQLPGFAGELTSTANLVDECWSGSALDCPPASGDGAILGDDR